MTRFCMIFQNPPKLDAPLFGTEDETEDTEVDPGLQDLQTNVF